MSPFHEMAGAAWLEGRAAQQFTPVNGTSGVFQLAATQNETTLQLINQFRFAAAKSIRTSTIILAAFNAVAAFTTVLGILYDCYTTKKRNERRYRYRYAPRGWRWSFGDLLSLLCSGSRSFVQAAEVYPLVLSIGISIQGMVFALAQAKGLDDLLSRTCTLVSQFMLPGKSRLVGERATSTRAAES